MKKTEKIRGIYLYLLVCYLFLPVKAEAVKLTIIAPSALEQVIEAGRDFYVIGKIDREGLTAAELPIDIRVVVAVTGDVRAGIGVPVRKIQSHVDEKTGKTPGRDINYRYEGVAPWVKMTREELIASPPPDLVYRNGDPESFFDPRIKAVVTEDSFATLVQGGCTKDFDTNYNMIYSEDLGWKLYRITVAAISGDSVLDKKDMDIMIGSVQDKMLARFSPAKHMNKVEKFAEEHGYRVYKDSFPGYWNFGLDKTYEIPRRWHPNDAIEYLEGRVHAVMYNIRETRCASQQIELGRIAFEGWLDSDEIFYYYYDIGEPDLRYKSWLGIEEKEGRLVRFEYGDRLVFTRADIGGKAGEYYPEESIEKVDWNVYNSVAINRGERITFYGAVTPIQPMLSEVIPNDDGTFTVGNRIDKVRYIFEDMVKGVVLTEERAVFLTRNYKTTASDGWSADSIYEFRHDFDLPETMYGRIVTVHVSAFDKKGDKITGSDESFYLRVR